MILPNYAEKANYYNYYKIGVMNWKEEKNTCLSLGLPRRKSRDNDSQAIGSPEETNRRRKRKWEREGMAGKGLVINQVSTVDKNPNSTGEFWQPVENVASVASVAKVWEVFIYLISHSLAEGCSQVILIIWYAGLLSGRTKWSLVTRKRSQIKN